ncbi:MAG TPA: hypothetical protein VF234_09630, partial [Limnochordia bacterium]
MGEPLFFAGGPSVADFAPDTDQDTWCSWEKGRLVGFRPWLKPGFACVAAEPALQAPAAPEPLELLRSLISPERWTIVRALLGGPKRAD